MTPSSPRLSYGLLAGLTLALTVSLAGCGGADTPALELSPARPSLLFFYTEN